MTGSYRDLDVYITGLEGFALSSPYGDGGALGQPLGVKSVGLVRVETDSGVTGLGESYTGVYAPELIGPVASFLEPLVVGRSAGDDAVADDLGAIPFIGRSGIVRSVASAIETAVWDIRGKLLERPTYCVIGDQCRQRVPVYASGGSAALSPAEVIHDVEAVNAAGYDAYKMRVGFQSWRDDLARVEAARDELHGPHLMVDAIMGTVRPPWSPDQAVARAKDLVDFELRWLEEPVHPDDLHGLAEVRRRGGVPIAAGEAYNSIGEWRTIFEKQAVDILQPDVTHAGGIRPCMHLARSAEALGFRTALHVWGSAVAVAANAQVALACPAVEILEIPMVQLELADQMWVEPPRLEAGVWVASDAPGLGVVVDDSMRERYALVPGSGYRLPQRGRA